MKRLFFTLKDIGLKRLLLRLKYELSKKFDHKFSWLWLKINSKLIKTPEWKRSLKELSLHKINFHFNRKNPNKTNKIDFNFLGDKKTLYFPIKWNNSSWNRLWQFNLHYFDWARQFLEESLNKDDCDMVITPTPMP